MCLEAKLNPRCQWADFGIIRENWFISCQAVSHSERLVCLANVRPFLSPGASFALPCKRHVSWHQQSSFLHHGHHKLLERSQLEGQSKVFLIARCLTEAPSGVGRGIAVRWYFRKKWSFKSWEESGSPGLWSHNSKWWYIFLEENFEFAVDGYLSWLFPGMQPVWLATPSVNCSSIL